MKLLVDARRLAASINRARARAQPRRYPRWAERSSEPRFYKVTLWIPPVQYHDLTAEHQAHGSEGSLPKFLLKRLDPRARAR